MSIQEASDFWDAHDFTEFDDVEEVKDLRFSLKKKKYIPLDIVLYRKIRQKAKKLHKTEERIDWRMVKGKGGMRRRFTLPLIPKAVNTLPPAICAMPEGLF